VKRQCFEIGFFLQNQFPVPSLRFFALQKMLDRDDGRGVKGPRFLASFFRPAALRSCSKWLWTSFSAEMDKWYLKNKIILNISEVCNGANAGERSLAS